VRRPNDSQLRSISANCAIAALAAVVASAAAGCTHHGDSPVIGAEAAATMAPVAPGASGTSICTRHLLRPEDVAGLFSAPIVASAPVDGDSQSCEFKTAGFPAVLITVRPGIGRATVEAWASGKMQLDVRPLAGVGDSAVWQSVLHEVVAQKNNQLCDIQVRGGDSDILIADDALASVVGALCNKIFSAS
jgi:hypothetical protein